MGHKILDNEYLEDMVFNRNITIKKVQNHMLLMNNNI